MSVVVVAIVMGAPYPMRLETPSRYEAEPTRTPAVFFFDDLLGGRVEQRWLRAIVGGGIVHVRQASIIGLRLDEDETEAGS